MKNVLCFYLIQLEHQSKMKNLYTYYAFVDMFKYISWTLNPKNDWWEWWYWWYIDIPHLIVVHLCNYIVLKTNLTCLNSLDCINTCCVIQYLAVEFIWVFMCFNHSLLSLFFSYSNHFFEVAPCSKITFFVIAINTKISSLVHTTRFWNNLSLIAGRQ